MKTTGKNLFHSETAVGEGFGHSRWDRGRGGGGGGGAFDINRPCLTCLGYRYASVIDFTVGRPRLTCPFSPQPITLDMTCTIYLWPLPMVDEEFRHLFCVCTVIDFTVERIRLTCLFSAQPITIDMTHVPAVDEEF